MLKHLVLLGLILAAAMPRICAAKTFVPPPSPRQVLDFNVGWKFFKGDVARAFEPSFDDTKWADVSTPHTFQ